MNILITGASGFIGGALARRLLGDGHRVTVLARAPQPALEALGARMFLGALADIQAIERATTGQEAVMHVAATTAMAGQWDHFYQTNVVGTQNMLNAAQRCRVRTFIYTSSPSVTFRPEPVINATESLPYTTSIWSAYAYSKALAEQAVLAHSSCGGMRTLALRPHLVWGPGDTHLIPTLVQQAQRHRLFQIGSDAVQADLTYIDNVVQGHVCALQAVHTGAIHGKAYFLTQNEPVALWPWVRNFLKQANLPSVRAHIPYPLAWALAAVLEGGYKTLRLNQPPPLTRFITAQLAYTHTYSSHAAMQDLGYSPQVTMAQGLQHLLAHYKQAST